MAYGKWVNILRRQGFKFFVAISIVAMSWSLFICHHREQGGCSMEGLSNNKLACVPLQSSFLDLQFNSTAYPMLRHQEAIVPNVIHFILFGRTNISFTEMVCILSAHVNHHPDAIWIHCDLCTDGVTMRGKYWDTLVTRHVPVLVHYFPEVTHIFNRKLASHSHSSDVARLMILMKHGGIFLDNDVFVVNALDRFRHYEMSLGWPTGNFIGSQVLVAHRNARFLQLWYDSYRLYDPSKWYYNAGELPTTSVLVPKPYLVHRVYLMFGVSIMDRVLYQEIWPEWQDFFTFHLLINHRYYLDANSSIVEFDERNIRKYNRTFGQMARLLLFGSTDIA